MVWGHLGKNEHQEKVRWVHDDHAASKRNQLFPVVITKFIDQVKYERDHASWFQHSILEDSHNSLVDKLVK